MTVLQLVQGATTVDLNDVTNTELREDFTPAAGGRKQARIAETVAVIVKGASVAALMAKREEIADMLRRGEEAAADRNLTPVYIQFQPTGAAAAWRSRLLSFTLANETGVFASPWDNLNTELTIAWERENWWETSSETQIPLSNTNATDNTSGLTVYNCDDGDGAPPTDRVNWVEIDSADIDGDLPSPLRLEITNNYNDASGAAIIYAGMLTHGDLANFSPVLEAESATGGNAPTADANASGGQYKVVSLATSGDVQMLTWTIAAAQVQALAGRTYKLIARFVSGTITDVWFYPYVYHSSVVPLRSGSLVRPADYYARVLRDLGAMQLPPWLGGVGSAGAIDLRLYGRRAVGTTLDIGIDFLFLMPTDGYREYSITGDLDYQSTLVDDGPNERAYTQDASAENRRGDVSVTGDPIHVIPGQDARIYFLHHSVLANSAPIARTLSIKAYYRARRLTL